MHGAASLEGPHRGEIQQVLSQRSWAVAAGTRSHCAERRGRAIRRERPPDLRRPRRQVTPFLSRRAVLLGLGSIALGLALPIRRAAAATLAARTFEYRVDISMLYALLRYSVGGSMVEEVDTTAGRYRVLITGTGTGVSTRIEAKGLIDNGLYRPLELKSAHSFLGRPSTLSISYDYARGLVDYHALGHTLLSGRRRQVDDVVILPSDKPERVVVHE